MRKVLGIQFALFMLMISMMISCAKTTPLGSDLLEGDQANIEFTDTLSLLMATIREDSIKAYDPIRPFDYYLVGNFNDPIFGNVNANIYSQLSFNSTLISSFEDAILDSIILRLEYDTEGFYGNTRNESQNISIYRLTENMDPAAIYYSNDGFQYDLIPLASVDFTPNLDSVTLISHANTSVDTTQFAPHLRISLGDVLGNEILSQLDIISQQPDSVTSHRDQFVDYFKGLHVRSNNQSNSMLSFNLQSTSVSKMTVYFTADTIKSSFSFSFGLLNTDLTLAKMTHAEHSFTPELESAFSGGSAIGDSILYLQALNGPNIQIEIPYANKISDAIINKAELEFTISVEENSDLPSPDQIIVVTQDDDGTYLIIEDVEFALVSPGGITNFGGQVEDAVTGEVRQVYKVNISGAFQDMADGLTNAPIFLRILPKQEQASRVKLFGPGHSQYPAELNLTYTRLNE